MTILIVCIGCSLLLALPQAQGQSERLKKLLPSVQVSYFEWARDSHSFVYSESSPEVIDSFGSDSLWTHYNLNTEAFAESSTYPFLPQLTPQEETIFVRTGNTFFYLSPDGRYLVYVGEKVLEGLTSRYWQLVIGDRQTQTTYTPEYPLYDPFGKEERFDARWSQDSRSFVLVTCVDQFMCFPSVFFYVRGLESGLSGMVFDWLSMTFPTVAGVEYRALELLDFSEDGTWALLTVGEDYGRGASHLMMYNVVIPQSSFLITDPMGIVPRSLRFATPDGSKMLYIDNQGIYRYDWANHTSTLLTTEVNNSKAKLGEFSPDGHWFVFVNSSRELYLYDLQGLPDTVTNPGGGLGDPTCPDGGGVWTWIDGVPVFVCGTTVE